MQGRIDKIVHSHGFGFIRSDDGREVFFHRSDLLELDFHRLKEGQTVQFELPQLKTAENAPRAIVVRSLRMKPLPPDKKGSPASGDPKALNLT